MVNLEPFEDFITNASTKDFSMEITRSAVFAQTVLDILKAAVVEAKLARAKAKVESEAEEATKTTDPVEGA